eukprot:TRINITY_DN1185_c0_g1_i3.p1 TRINITY_DN1185_c0_g1~~TRINITY_DN1185_c0_g1_i3.p1  ORF type:complete len:245 (-),score=60.48 TRINITY_DN1185_c0_g1_i3:236-970(-)
MCIRDRPYWYDEADPTNTTTWEQPQGLAQDGTHFEAPVINKSPPPPAQPPVHAQAVPAQQAPPMQQQQQQQPPPVAGQHQPAPYAAVMTFTVVHPAGVAYRATPHMANKALDISGPTPGSQVAGTLVPAQDDSRIMFLSVGVGRFLPLSNPEGHVLLQQVQAVAPQQAYSEQVIVQYRMGAAAWCMVVLLVLLFWPLCWLPCVCEQCQDQEVVRVRQECPQAPLLQHHGQPHHAPPQHGHHSHC